MQELRDALREFAKAQVKYSSYGACDSEPHWLFKSILNRAVNAKPARIPNSGEGWELYSSSMDCSEAAKALTDAASKAVNLIENAPMKNMSEVRSIVEGY